MTLPRDVFPTTPEARARARSGGRTLGLSHHAVEQYVARYSGTEAECRALASQAVPTKERTANGQEVWVADGVRFVVKRDRGIGPVAVTTLPPAEAMSGYDESDLPEGGWW